jgi:sugar lactone lactonase YvrE
VAGGNDQGNAANQLFNPQGIWVDAVGNLYVTDSYNQRIQKWARGASSGTTVAGGNGIGNAANQFNFPLGVWVDAVGNVYVADNGNYRIQKWAPGASQGVTVAGGNGQGSAANQFYSVNDVAVDAAGNIYVADADNNRVQKWVPGATSGTTVASTASTVDQFFEPLGIFVDAAGNLYVADGSSSRILKFAPGASQGVIVAGGNKRGSAANQLSNPTSVWVDAMSNIYVADQLNHRIQKWTPGATSGTTVAGGNGPGDAANQLKGPEDVAVDAANNIYVSDPLNNRVQRFSPLVGPTISSLSASPNPVCVGGSVSFTATLGNATGAYNYTLTNGAGSAKQGTASTTAFSQSLTATGAGTQSFTLTVANGGNAATATASLTVTPQSQDYQPLVDLYNATSGPSWNRNDNWLTGCSPCGWYGVTCDGNGRVTGLDLSRNNLSGPLPASLGNLNNLQSLDLSQNALTGPIPASLGNLTRLQTLSLFINQLSGSIPASLGNLTRLDFLQLSNNQLTGSIPPSLGNLTRLLRVNLSVNQLSGSIPASLGNLTNLQELSLTLNQLSGTIPMSLSNLTGLETLALGANRLTGSIPESLSALVNLQVFDLSINALSGPIPTGLIATLASVAYLRRLALNDNQLSGCFPASLSALCGKSVNFQGNPGLPGGGSFVAFCARGLGSDAFRPLATGSPNPVCAGNPVSLSVSAGTSYAWSGPAGFSADTQMPSFTPASAASSGLYAVTVGNGSPTCSATASVSLTVNPLPVVLITGLGSAYCQDAPAVTLTGTPAGGRFIVNGAPATQIAPANLAPGSYTVAYSYTDSNGCSAITSQHVTINALPTVSIVPSALTGCAGTIITLSALGADRYVWNTGATTTSIPVTATGTSVYSVTGTTTSTGCSATAAQSITIYPLPVAPTLLTQTGQSSVTVDVNSGNVNLVVGGCNGTINWTGPAGTSGTSSPIVVSTERVGQFVYTATCTSAQGCTSPATSATVTVQGRLTVLHRDVDNYADNNAIQPLVVLQNQGSTALPLSALTLRYYLTVEGSSALSNLSVNYAQVGGQNVRLRYVPLTPPQSGAGGYVEVSFTQGAGNLAAGANSGPIQAYFAKSDYGSLYEPDDYSYNPVRDQLTATQRITAYYDGALIAGIEPGSGAQIRSVRALTESRNGASATQINTVLEVRNEGTVAINYSALRARYYFTSDGNERLQVEVDEGNVSARLVRLPQAVNGADTYLEISFNQGGQLASGASTGAIRYRISKPDGGRFNQANDYSYQEQPQDRAQNSRVVVLAGSEIVWGTPPTGAPARLAFAEAGNALSVKVLGNPIQNDQVSFEVTGAEGQALQLQLLTPQGRIVNQQLVPRAQVTQQHQLSVAGQAGGLLLLQVSTPTQSQTVKVLRTN